MEGLIFETCRDGLVLDSHSLIFHSYILGHDGDTTHASQNPLYYFIFLRFHTFVFLWTSRTWAIHSCELPRAQYIHYLMEFVV